MVKVPWPRKNLKKNVAPAIRQPIPASAPQLAARASGQKANRNGSLRPPHYSSSALSPHSHIARARTEPTSRDGHPCTRARALSPPPLLHSGRITGEPGNSPLHRAPGWIDASHRLCDLCHRWRGLPPDRPPDRPTPGAVDYRLYAPADSDAMPRHHSLVSELLAPLFELPLLPSFREGLCGEPCRPAWTSHPWTSRPDPLGSSP